MSEVYAKATKSGKLTRNVLDIKLRNGSSKANFPQSSVIQTLWTDTASGVKNPRWKQQVRDGVQAGTPFTGGRQRIITRPCYIDARLRRTNGLPLAPTHEEFWTQYGSVTPPDPGSPSGLSEVLADNRAKLYISRKIRSAQTSFQGLVFTGEIGQTIKLMANTALQLKKGLFNYGTALQQARRRNAWRNLTPKQRAKKRLEFASDRWLESQLGWAPLLSEIDSGAKALAEASVGVVGDRWKPLRAVGYEKIMISDSEVSIPSTTVPIYFKARRRTYSLVSVRYIACVDAGIASELNNQRVGFAPSNWLPSIWELIPYSFVIDYFTNIGAIIDSACLMRSSIKWMIKTVRREKVSEYYNWYPYFPSTAGIYTIIPLGFSPGKSIRTQTLVDRSPYTGSIVPDLEFKLPSSAKQVANLVGLAVMRNKLKNYFS